MGSLDELVQEEDLDQEMRRKTDSNYLNLLELEKIQYLIQMDLLDESKLLRNFVNPLLSPLCFPIHVMKSKITKNHFYQNNSMNA
jgi:hypothetical protein